VSEYSVAVVILNWNGLPYLQNFLGTVCEYSRADAEIWVVDNASSDGSVVFIQEQHPEIKLLILDKNYGFAEGYNRGLAQIDADIFVLLNSDVEVTKNWIRPIISCMQGDELLVACQPLILDYNKKECFEHAGAAGGYLDRDAYPFCAGRLFDTFEKNEGQYTGVREIFWASGAALFVKSKAYKDCTGLDGDFFAHMEEIDLCWRLKNRGFKIGVCGESSVYHIGGGTLNRMDPKKTFLNFRNNLYLIVKNDFESFFVLRLLRRMILDGVAAARFILEGKPAFFNAVMKAHFNFFSNTGKTWRKRISNKKNLANPNNHGRYRGSIVLEYFLRKKHFFKDLNPSDFA